MVNIRSIKQKYTNADCLSTWPLFLSHETLHSWVLKSTNNAYITSFSVQDESDAIEMCRNFMTSFNMNYSLEVINA